MKNTSVYAKILALASVFLLMTMPGACRKKAPAAETAAAAPTAEPVLTVLTAAPAAPEAPAASPAPASEPGRQDGERFEDVIIMEGMEETVRYEHIRSDTIGFEMDYDYESFVRRSEPDRECFVSVYDSPENPENYLEGAYSPEDASSAADSVGKALSEEYDIIRESYDLDRAGSCIRIDASGAKGGGGTPDLLQMVYIIPAPDGCRIATAHYGFESAEGFGRRFAYMVKTLSVIARKGETVLSDEQAVSSVRNYCYTSNPDLEGIVNAGESQVYWEIASSSENEIVVLFRSYTGAQIRYYIDRASGDVSVTEFVPGITSGEQPTGESFNVRDYM